MWKKKKRTPSREWKMPRDGTRCEVLVDAAAAKARGVSRMSTIAQSVSGACDFGVPLGARTDLRIHCERSSFEDGHQRIGTKMFRVEIGLVPETCSNMAGKSIDKVAEGSFAANTGPGVMGSWVGRRTSCHPNTSKHGKQIQGR